jgi:hypothetical protein
MQHQPAPCCYAVGPGQGVPGSAHDVKASGRSTTGSLTVLPRNVPDRFAVAGGPATALIVTSGGLDEYLAELHAALTANATAAQIKDIQDAYGVAAT